MNNFIKINDYLINVNNIVYIEEKYDSAYEYNNENVKHYFMTSTIYFTGASKLVLKGTPLIELERLLNERNHIWTVRQSNKNACQPLYGKIIDLEKTVLALSRIATEYPENL